MALVAIGQSENWPSENGSSENRPSENGPSENGPSENGPSENGLSENGWSEEQLEHLKDQTNNVKPIGAEQSKFLIGRRCNITA